MKLTQPTISEIASYKTPPKPVNMVMKENCVITFLSLYFYLLLWLQSFEDFEADKKVQFHTFDKAVYIVLGENKQDVNDWALIRSLIRKLGRQSLKSRITNFQFDQCEPWRIKYAAVSEIYSKFSPLAEIGKETTS